MSSPVKILGERITTLRVRSPFPDRSTFSNRAGMSVEGLRKIENGTRMAEKRTIQKLLDISGAPKDVAEEVWVIWKRAMSVKYKTDDITSPEDVETERSDRSRQELIRGVANEMVAVVNEYLESCDYELPDEWPDQVARIMEVKLEAALPKGKS